MTAPQSRPRVVTAAFWCWVLASLLLIAGGMIAASVALPAVYRGAGVITAIGGAGMAYLAGRSRRGDTRSRRAALTLSAVLPLIAGTVLMTRPAALSSPDQESQ